MFDQLIPFTFEEHSVRGTLVRLSGSWKKVLEGGEASRDSSGVISRLLGEMLVSGLLLSSTLKLKGTLLIQILGEGPVSMLLVEVFVNEQGGALGFRSMVKCNQEEVARLGTPSIKDLVGSGTLSITLDPKDGSQSYQSIVPVSNNSVGEIFESYMHQSEQIRTRLLLCTSENQVSGLLLQEMPSGKTSEQSMEMVWNRLGTQAEVCMVTSHNQIPANVVLQSLFPEDLLRVYDPRDISFTCTCSRDKIGALLMTLGKEDSEAILQEEGSIKVSCEFCNMVYEFDAIDTADLFLHSGISKTSEWEN